MTAQAQWTSGEPRHVQVSATGLAAAGERGESVVTARYQGHSASVRILVLPDGTFRISGRVTEGAFPLVGAAISIVAGTGTGLSVTTTERGEYVLYGVAGTVRLRATLDGYLDQIQDLQVSEHRVLNIEMRATARPNLAGRYLLEISAAGCDEGFPEEARRRSYDAVIEQGGSRLRVRLSGAEFVIVRGRGDNFGGLVEPDEDMMFAIGAADYSFYYYSYYGPLYDLAERLDSTRTLLVNGTVNARTAASGITGVLTGSLAVAPRTAPPFWPRSAACTSSSHRFEMRRR